MAVKGILFDKDGTIIDFAATFEPATNLVLNELCQGDQVLLQKAANAVRFDLANVKIANDSIIVAGSSMGIAKLLGPVLGRRDLAEFAVEIDLRFGRACAETVTELPGSSNSIRQLHAEGLQLGVATNDAAANAVTQMERLEISVFFQQIFGADSGFGAKPGAGMIEAFVDVTGFNREEIMMVGDSTHDLEAGRAAGVATCGVLTGPAQHNELSPHADHVLDSIGHLPKLVHQLNAM